MQDVVKFSPISRPHTSMNLKKKILVFLVFLFLLCDCRDSGDQQDDPSPSQAGPTSSVVEEVNHTERSSLETEYRDPKGFFVIAQPNGWRKHEYPEDPRGKVGFSAPGDAAWLRVLAQASDGNVESLINNIRQLEKKTGIDMNIEPFVCNGKPAIKCTATFISEGITYRALWIHLLVEGIYHNLQYSSSPSEFDRFYDVAWRTMSTYEPLGREISPEDVRRHEVAKCLRLAEIAAEMGKTQIAREICVAGLTLDPNNEELLKIKDKLEAK